MNQMTIFDPAMCCSTGVCGPSVDKNLLRVATIIDNLDQNGVKVTRHNPASDPKIFIQNQTIKKLLNKKGVDILPVTVVNDEVVKTKDYPSDQEFIQYLDIPEDYIKAKAH